jgi:hypothetical protein
MYNYLFDFSYIYGVFERFMCHNFKIEIRCPIIITVNRKILVMVLFWPILAPKYEVPKLSTPKYVTLQKLDTF